MGLPLFMVISQHVSLPAIYLRVMSFDYKKMIQLSYTRALVKIMPYGHGEVASLPI